MPVVDLRRLILDLAEIGTRAVTFTGGGEPLMHPHIADVMDLVLKTGIDLSIITNGQGLNAMKADVLRHAKWVRVSIDYSTPTQMVKSRNVPIRFFNAVLNNIREFSKMKDSSCDLGVNFIVTRENADWLVAGAQRLKAAGVENIRYSPVYLDGFHEYHAPIAEHVEAQLAIIQTMCDDSFSVNSTYDLASPSKKKMHAFSRCLYAQTVPVVGADLNVYACHNTAYSKHGLLGSIRERGFKDFWFSDECATALRAINPSIVCRHECANHAKVDLFNRLADAATDNFV